MQSRQMISSPNHPPGQPLNLAASQPGDPAMPNPSHPKTWRPAFSAPQMPKIPAGPSKKVPPGGISVGPRQMRHVERRIQSRRQPAKTAISRNACKQGVLGVCLLKIPNFKLNRKKDAAHKEGQRVSNYLPPPRSKKNSYRGGDRHPAAG